MKRRDFLKGCLAVGATGLLAGCSGEFYGKNNPKKPNIIFILADDMGYGDLSCYGAEKVQTPNIDRLAREGVLFTDGHCGASTCTPTRYGLLTGRNNWRTWLKYSALSTSAPMLIEEGRMTLASMLKEELSKKEIKVFKVFKVKKVSKVLNYL